MWHPSNEELRAIKHALIVSGQLEAVRREKVPCARAALIRKVLEEEYDAVERAGGTYYGPSSLPQLQGLIQRVRVAMDYDGILLSLYFFQLD